MKFSNKIARFPSLFTTHLKANWKRGIVVVLGLFTIVLILNEALITASSIAMYSVTRRPPEGAVVPEAGLTFSLMGTNPAFFGNGFPRGLNQIRTDTHGFMMEAIERAKLKIVGSLRTNMMLDTMLYAWMKDFSSDSNLDETFLQFNVIGLDDELLAQMGFSTTGATMVVLDRQAVNLVPISPEEREELKNDFPYSYPDNETIYRIEGAGYSERYGISFPYGQFYPDGTLFIHDSWVGEFYGTVLKNYLQENDSLVLRSAPSSRQSSLVSTLPLESIRYYSVPQITSSIAASNFYESSPVLTSLVALGLTSYYSESEGAFIFVPNSFLYSTLDAYFRSHELETSPYNGSFLSELMPVNRLIALYDFVIDLEYYSNHLEELPSSWARVEEILRQNGMAYFPSLIPELKSSNPTNETKGPEFDVYQGEAYVSLNSPYTLSSRVFSLVGTFFVVLFYLLILGLPVIILALFAGNFSTNLAMRGLHQQVSVYRVRGMLSRQVFMLLMTEVLLMVILGTIMSFLGAIPLTALILSSRGILMFDFNPIPVVLPLEWLSRVVIVGLILGFLLRIRTVIRLSRSPIRQTEVLPLESEPYWKRKNLDVIALAWGIIGVLFFINLRSIFQFSLPGILIFLLGLLFIPAPVFLLVGVILFLSRFIPIFLQFLKKLAEKMDVALPVLVLRDLSMRKHVVARAILLIAFGMATAALIMGFPVNMLHHDRRTVYYNIGSDFMIDHEIDSQFKHELLGNLSDFDVRITEWQLITLNVGFGLQNGSSARLTLLGINSSTFADTAFFENNFGLSRLGLQGALQKLDEDPMSTALVSTKSKEELELTIPSTLHFQSRNPPPFNGTNITLVDEYAYWPRLIDYFRSPQVQEIEYYGPSDLEKELVLVVDLRLTLLVANQSALSNQANIEEGYYLKVLGDDSIKDEVAYRLTALQVTFSAAHTSLLTRNEEFSRVFFSMNNAFLVIVLAVVSLVIVLLALIYQRERWKDMGVERTLGMSKKQLYAYNILSTVIMSVVGIVIGISMGLLLMYTFLSVVVTFLSGMVPPLVIVMPFTELLMFLVFISMFIAAGSALALYMSSRRSITNILKVE